MLTVEFAVINTIERHDKAAVGGGRFAKTVREQIRENCVEIESLDFVL